jgi:hypothetical protein
MSRAHPSGRAVDACRAGPGDDEDETPIGDPDIDDEGEDEDDEEDDEGDTLWAVTATGAIG